jgi:glycosyltransferase involved in cell wall biosynthesis
MMKVLHIIDSVNPDQGGPLAFAINMSRERALHGHSSVFVATDPEDAIWIEDFPFPVVCAPKSRRGVERAIAEVCGTCDVAIVHGLWNNASIGGYKALRKKSVPWFLYPHGMLDPYFKRIKPIKNLVKHLYWILWQGRMLSGATRVLFTCQEELTLAQNAFIGHNLYKRVVVSYCAVDQKLNEPDQVKIDSFQGRDMSRPYLLFLSRIHPKKAIDNLLRAYAAVSENFPSVDLIIAGPNKNDYGESMKALVEKLGLGSRVIWTGPVKGDVKRALFSKAKAFVLPSHQENFGQVVAESLSTGTPVLISDKVNIHKEISQNGVGLICKDTTVSTREMLEAFLTLSEKDYVAMKEAARPTYERLFSLQSAYADLHQHLEKAAKKR